MPVVRRPTPNEERYRYKRTHRRWFRIANADEIRQFIEPENSTFSFPLGKINDYDPLFTYEKHEPGNNTLGSQMCIDVKQGSTTFNQVYKSKVADNLNNDPETSPDEWELALNEEIHACEVWEQTDGAADYAPSAWAFPVDNMLWWQQWTDTAPQHLEVNYSQPQLIYFLHHPFVSPLDLLPCYFNSNQGEWECEWRDTGEDQLPTLWPQEVFAKTTDVITPGMTSGQADLYRFDSGTGGIEPTGESLNDIHLQWMHGGGNISSGKEILIRKLPRIDDTDPENPKWDWHVVGAECEESRHQNEGELNPV